MRTLIFLALTTALAAPYPTLAQTPDAPPAPPAPAQADAKPKSGGAVETVGKTLGGVLGSSAGAAGGPLGSAAGGLVGQTVGKGLAGFVRKLFGGGNHKSETEVAQAAAPSRPDAASAGVDTAAQAPVPEPDVAPPPSHEPSPVQSLEPTPTPEETAGLSIPPAPVPAD